MRLFLGLSFLFLFAQGCKNSSGSRSAQTSASEAPPALLVEGEWQVAYIEVPQGRRTGAQMGNPLYRFTADYYRIKSYITPPHSDSVRYSIVGDTISYPGSALPSVTILHLNADSLALESQNDQQVRWSLYRKD